MVFANKSIIRYGAASMLALLLCAPSALAQDKASASATAIIESTGPKAGDNGKRYLNVEGKEKGKYACFGLVQFDGAAVKSTLDKKYGAGKYKVTGLTLELGRSTASFSAAGKVSVYSLAGKVDAAALKYPLDLKGNLKPALLGNIAFTVSEKASGFAAAEADKLDLMKGGKGADILSTLAAGGVVTLALAEGDSKVAATWAGKENNRVSPPTLAITITKKK